MAKAASLSGNMIRRGITVRTVRIIGPDGEFQRVVMPVEQEQIVEYRACRLCGHNIAVDKSS